MNTNLRNLPNKPLLLALALPLLAPLGGCEPEAAAAVGPSATDASAIDLPSERVAHDQTPDLETKTCTLEARPSAIVSLVDESGDEIAGPHASVTYSFESQTANHVASCTDATCEHWRVGNEKPGTVDINAAACGGEGSTRVRVTMTSDGCHVDTEYAEITVNDAECGPDITTPPPACNPVAAPSLVVIPTLQVDDFLLPVDIENLDIGLDDRSFPVSCLDAGCTQWVGPWATEGTFVVEASACGQTKSQRVVVDGGDCGVNTEYVVMTFDGHCTAAGIER